MRASCSGPPARATRLIGGWATLLPELRRFVSRQPGGEATLARVKPFNGRGDLLLALFDESQLRRILARMLDEALS